MKSQYIAPATSLAEIASCTILAGSVPSIPTGGQQNNTQGDAPYRRSIYDF